MNNGSSALALGIHNTGIPLQTKPSRKAEEEEEKERKRVGDTLEDLWLTLCNRILD